MDQHDSRIIPNPEEISVVVDPPPVVHFGLQHQQDKKDLKKNGFSKLQDNDDDEEDLDLVLEEGNGNGKGKKSKCCMSCNYIVQRWKQIENTPLKFVFLFVLFVLIIPVCYVISVLVYEGLLGLWEFTAWWTGSTAKAFMTLGFCILVALVGLIIGYYALYVPEFRDACCGPRIASHCDLDYRNDCCECWIHFCQECLNND